MDRPAKGRAVLEQAKQAIASVKTAEDLKAAHAVVHPLDFGFSLP